MTMKLLVSFALCALLSSAVAADGGTRQSAMGGAVHGPGEIQREVVMSLTVQRLGTGSGEDRQLRLGLPPEQSTYHALRSVEVPEDVEVKIDPEGKSAVAAVDLSDLRPFESRHIAIRLQLGFSDMPLPQILADRGMYMEQERYIEVNAPLVQKTARSLLGNDGYETAGRVHAWVGKNVRYSGYRGTVRGALWALKEREGDCTEFACLFVALCRANGIPARVMSGYLCDGCTVLSSSSYHNWAEFYWDGAWRMADPLRGAFDSNGDEYIAFADCSEHVKGGIGPFKRFELTGGPGDITVKWP